MIHSNTRKILVVLGTRPEAIKLCPVVLAMKEDPRFEVAVCFSGQHRDMVRPICDLFGVEIDYDLDVMEPGQTLTHVTTAVIERIKPVFEAVQPDVVIVQGDTTTAFCGALAGFYHKVEVAHVEAGLRTNDLMSPWPEEGNRALIGRLTGYHFAPTEGSRENLERENAQGEIIVTGNTVVDAARIAAAKITGPMEAEIAARLGVKASNRKRILFTMHRRESHGEPVERVFRALRQIASQNDVEILFPVHPNPAIMGPATRILSQVENIHLLNPLAYDEIIYALQTSDILVTDSGGLAEEAPTFGCPALILRESTERPECVDSGNAILVGYDTDLLQQLVGELLGEGELYEKMANAPNPFGDGYAANYICNALAAEAEQIAVAA